MNKRQSKKLITKATKEFRKAMAFNYGGWYREHNRSSRFTILPCDKEFNWNIDKHNLRVIARLYGVDPLQDNESSVEFKERIRRGIQNDTTRRV